MVVAFEKRAMKRKGEESMGGVGAERRILDSGLLGGKGAKGGEGSDVLTK